MTQEEKQLLLKDLCGRVIYNTKVRVIGDWFYEEREPYDSILTFMIMKTFEENDNLSLIIKPYLRSLSSMTEEEAKEVCRLENFENRIICVIPNNHTYHFTVGDAVIDWLLAHHFDYCGLIEKGLALEAPEDMYKTEKNMTQEEFDDVIMEELMELTPKNDLTEEEFNEAKRIWESEKSIIKTIKYLQSVEYGDSSKLAKNYFDLYIDDRNYDKL